MIDLKKYLLVLLLFLSPAAFALPLQDSVSVENTELSSDSGYSGTESEESVASGPSADETYLQDSVKKISFNKTEWKKITKGIDYTESSEKPKKIDTKQYIPTQDSPSWFNMGSSTAQTILIVVAALLLGFVLFRLFKGSVSNTKVKKEKTYSIEELEDAFHESDLERYLQEAILFKRYRDAIRIYYLMALKQLSEREWIHWKKDKTNSQYLYEMSTRPNFSGFREITRLFEYTWYGEMQVEEKQFSTLDPKFRTFLQTLNTLPS